MDDVAATLAGSWPFVGREREIAAVSAALARPRTSGLLLAGPAGAGKTRLADECAAIAARVGFRTVRVRGTGTTREIPLGALAGLLPAETTAVGHRNWLRGAADAIAAGSGPMLLVVDDAHLLDDASAAVVHQLTTRDHAFVVLTVRSGGVPAELLTGLWKDGLVERLDLAPLARADVGRLLEAVLPGGVEGGATFALHQACQGNVLFLRELVRGAVETGTLRREHGVWRLDHALPNTPRLVELVSARLVGLSEPERDLLVLIAIGEPLAWEVLVRLGQPEQLAELERRGLVDVAQRGDGIAVSLAHPLYGEVLREQLSPLRRMAACRRLAEAAGPDVGGRTGALQRAVWQLDGGVDVDPEVLLQAASDARRAGHFALAERLAVAAGRSATDERAGLLLARVLSDQGRHEEAQRLLGTLGPRADGDAARATVAIERARALLYWLGRGAEAAAVLEAAEPTLQHPWRAQVHAHRAMVALMRGRLPEALRAATGIGAAEAGHGLVTTSAVTAVAAALAGWNADAAHYVDRAEQGPEPGRARLARAVMLCESGRLGAADAHVGEQYERALALRHRSGQVWFAMMRGRIALLRGRLVAARQAFAEGAAVAVEAGELGLRRWCLAGATLAAAQAGDRAGAGALLGELDRLPATDMDLLEPDVLRARAWVEVAAGRTDRAIELLHRAAETAQAAGAGALAAAAWYDLARIGSPADAAPLLVLAAGCDDDAVPYTAPTDNPLIAARAAHVAALCDRDPVALTAVADTFAASGADLFAAEAAAAAAAEYRGRSDGRAADRLATQARAFLRGCEPADTPALQLAGPVAALTRREREIGVLAARGMSNQDIAAELTLSVRTVETHLHRAFGKLAVTTRTELAAALRDR